MTPTAKPGRSQYAEGAYRGRVVQRAGGFQALKPFGKEFYSVDVRLAGDSRTGSRGHIGTGPALRAPRRESRDTEFRSRFMLPHSGYG